MAPTTGFEDSGGSSWTTLAEETEFLQTIAAETDAALSQAGESVLGEPIWRIDIGDPAGPTWMVVGGVHGDEPAAREAAFQHVRDLAYSTDGAITAYLASHRIVYVANCNPDATETFSHRNANGIDINQNHWSLDQPEARAVQEVFTAAGPTILADLHERDSVGLGTQMLYRRPELAVLAQTIRDRGDLLLADLQADLDTESISHDIYPVPGRRSLREAAGLRHAIGVLIETDKVNDTTTDRVDFQYVALESMRGFHEDNAAALGEMAADSRAYQAGTDDQYLLQTGNFGSPPWDGDFLPAELTGYDLDGSIPPAVRIAYDVTVTNDRVQLAQPARAVIPIILDEDSDDALVSTTRVLGEASVPPGSEDPGLPQVAQADPRTEVTWLSCDLVTGRIIGELPDITADKLPRVLGEITSAKLTIPIPSVGNREMLPSERAELAMRLTAPFQTMIVPVVNAVPMAAFMPLDPVGGTAATLEVPSVSLEGYLDYRYVRDHRWRQRDEASVIAAGLLADTAVPILGFGGGINLVVDAPPTGTLRDRTYVDSDNATVYERLRELADVRDGPEWTIDVDWADDRQTSVAKIARVRKQIGAASPAVFQSRSRSDTRYVFRRRTSGGKFANVVRAYSSGQGEDQPRSQPVIDTAALDSGQPIVEKRYSPGSSITSRSVLDGHAQAEMTRVRRGARTWDITARWDAWPRYGVDWQLGDLVGAHLFGQLHPDGVVITARVIGYDLDTGAGTITPILLDPLEAI